MTRTENVEVAVAFCCIEGGSSISGCSCVKPDHGTAWVQRKVAEPEPGSDAWLKRSPNYHPGDLA